MRTLLLLSILVVGCGKPTPPAVKPPAGYKYEVEGGGGWTKGGGTEFNITRNAIQVEVREGQLTVNGIKYGAVPDGATIVVEESRRVLVNGKEWIPPP